MLFHRHLNRDAAILQKMTYKHGAIAVQSVSVNQAIGRGLATVYGPFFPLVFGIPAVILILATPLHLPGLLSLLSVPLGIAAAWVWWSYQVPHWRIWALERVDDIEALHQRAVQVGIEWPYGHFLERTEIKSHQQLLQELRLLLRYYLRRTQKIVENYSGAHFDDLTQEIASVLSQVNAGQVIALSLFDLLEQSLMQLISQHDELGIDARDASLLAITVHFIAKYRGVIRPSQTRM
jgi:hypothetical protein